MAHVLIVDDEPSICWGFQQLLTGEGYTVAAAASAEDGLEAAGRQPPDAIVLDVRLPGMDGLTALGRFRGLLGEVPVIVITAFGDLETAVRAVREGAFDYLTKPFDLDHAADVVDRAVKASRRTGESEPGEPAGEDSPLVGASAAMQEVFKQIALAATADVPVLITGESGTGKELVARAIHRHSPRGEGPFVPVCLPALSEGLVESELFGHVKGAFTGATHDRQGLLELAADGTVLLDEIADATAPLQIKLLRALEQREVTPVGGVAPRRLTGRIVAATNRPLGELIAQGRFREDLYFRLSVFHIQLPPLRERNGDVPVLAEHFLRRARPDAPFVPLPADTVEVLASRDWPGNVRELRNVIEHAALVSRGGPIRPDHLPPPDRFAFGPADGKQTGDLPEQIRRWARQSLAEPAETRERGVYDQFLEACEPALLRAVLEHYGQNRAAAAETLGIHRSTLRQKLRRHGIE
jgi:two-component system nitrogen regulation response regulator GlnG